VYCRGILQPHYVPNQVLDSLLKFLYRIYGSLEIVSNFSSEKIMGLMEGEEERREIYRKNEIKGKGEE
jgi:hypothetical protein